MPTAKRKSVGSGYVSSGRFRADLESQLGKLKKRAKPEKRKAWLDEALGRLPAKVATEVSALFDLYAVYAVPRLCGLRSGGYCSKPDQHDLDEDGVREERWFTKDADIELVMNSVEIYEDQGSPFVLVAKAGVCLFYKDPYGYRVVAKDLESFLRALLAVEAAARGKVSPQEARKVLAAKIHDKTAREQEFFMRTLEKAED